jgi:hypothetical protein
MHLEMILSASQQTHVIRFDRQPINKMAEGPGCRQNGAVSGVFKLNSVEDLRINFEEKKKKIGFMKYFFYS